MVSGNEFASSGSATPLQSGAPFNPDGTPLEDAEELAMMNELQRVQREIAQRRVARKRRLEEQLMLAGQ